MNLDKLRREYLHGDLRRADLHDSPIDQFEHWQQQAIDLQIQDPTAMVLATASRGGQPSQRIVLLKHLDARGFVFYTNYGSRKAREIRENSRASLLFPWHVLDRQVKVSGRIEMIPPQDSADYFASRPRDSQLAAWASPQSREIDSRETLMKALEAVKARFEGEEVPLPEGWGGYRVLPTEMEFWQGGEHRLHDCFQYSRQDDGSWIIRRLAP